MLKKFVGGVRSQDSGFGRKLSVRLSVRVSELVELLSSRGSTERSTELTPKSRRTSEVSPNVRSLAERPKSHAEVRTESVVSSFVALLFFYTSLCTIKRIMPGF